MTKRKKRKRLTTAQHLRELDLFVECSDEQLLAADNLMTEVTIGGGQTLTIAGTAGREAMIILEGTVEVWADGRLVDRIGPGTVVGEIALLDGVLRTATVLTRTPVRLLALNTGEFHTLLRTVPCVGRRIHELARIRRAHLASLLEEAN